jgi:LuxR family transcriptional regulator, maltose regulon positive regulatory protein
MGTAVQYGTADVAAPAVLRGGVVYRRALLRRLERAGRVVQVSAPAGSGKTVLLRSWIGEAGLTDSVAWVPVQSGEHDPQRFWVSLADGLRGTFAGSKLVRPLTAAPDLNGWAGVQRLLEDLGSLEDRLWLVIDDLHELRSADALAQLESLVMRAPPELRFVLSARQEPRLGLHRLRLEGELTEIRPRDMRFTLDETRALFDAAGAELTDSALAQLHARTEGWAAGLRLAVLSLSAHQLLARFPAGAMAADAELTALLAARAGRTSAEEVALPEVALPEPLTDSETRILRHLTSHLTAPEIAGHLYLSVHTVTTHLRHIYAKLGVHRRREAVDRARALGLLAP